MDLATAIPIPRPRRNRRFAERCFFCAMAAAILATVFVGFAPSFYLKGVVPGTRPLFPLTPLVIFHGCAFTGWVVLLAVQTALVTAGRVDLHRRLGLFGAGLAALMVAVGIMTAIYAAKRGSHPPGTDSLHFLVVPLFDISVFALLVFLGVRARRDPPAHKRLMLLSTLAILTAAVARWPLAIMHAGPIAFFSVSDLFLLPLLAFDLATLGRIHRASLLGIGAIVISQPLRLAIAGTGAWLAFAGWLVSLVS